MLVVVFGELSEAVSLEFLVLLRILERRDINGKRELNTVSCKKIRVEHWSLSGVGMAVSTFNCDNGTSD